MSDRATELRSTGDTTFVLEQHTPEPTPLEEKNAPMTAFANPIEQAKAQITGGVSTTIETKTSESTKLCEPTKPSLSESITAAPNLATASSDLTKHSASSTETTTTTTSQQSPTKTTTPTPFVPIDTATPTPFIPIDTATTAAPESIHAVATPFESTENTATAPPTTESTYSTPQTSSTFLQSIRPTEHTERRDDTTLQTIPSTAYPSIMSSDQKAPVEFTPAPLPLTSDDPSSLPQTSSNTTSSPKASSDKQNMACPDPSAHRDTKLQESASAAALYATKSRSKSKPRDDVLDANNKLSSRSAATSLKYASPRDLPSYPIVGIDTSNSAHSAATLANTGHKNFEHWKPDASKNAGIAAMTAKDYKMAPLWKPETSAAGSKAALLAHKDGPKLNLWHPEASAEGNSAANIAMRNKNLGPKLDYGYTEDGHKKALMAATGAVTKSQSQSVKSPPVRHPQYPDSANSAHNALNAASVAHTPSNARSSVHQDSNDISSDAMRAARVQNMGRNVPREMFGAAPPVSIEVEEKAKQAALRASAISMAKQMYEQSEKKRRDGEAAEVQARLGTNAATASHSRAASTPTSAQPDLRQQAVQYIRLQEAAQKLANERLAKMDPDGAASYRAHYGYEQQPPRSRLSLRNRPGKGRAEGNPKAVQNDDDSSDDEFRSRRIRNQMSSLNNSVAQQDEKRNQDRAALLAAAEKKVQAQMHAMDEQVFQQTGKVTPAMMDEWEAKARARASANSETRQQNFGKVDIGGGKYMDQSELNAIAQARLQPTLNEINENAEKKRAREEEIRLDQEERKRQQMSEKGREKELKAEQKRQKDKEKAEAKAAKRAEKDLERNRKAEEKQSRKEEKRRSKEVKRDTEEATNASAASTAGAAAVAGIGAGAGAAALASEEHSKTKDDDDVKDVDTDRTSAADNDIVAVTDGAPLSKTDSPDLMTRVTTGGTEHTTQTGLRPEIDRHVSAIVSSSSSSARSSSLSSIDEDIVSQPVPVAETEPTPLAINPVKKTEGEAVAITTPAAVGAKTARSVSFEGRRSSRVGGFFSRFSRKTKPAEKSQSQTTGIKPLPASEAKNRLTKADPASTGNAATGATAVTADAPVTSDAVSDSSFRRHDTDLHSISSVSSDEDVHARRRGRSISSDSSSSSEEEEFEEARDNFDESLAPPPTFGGQLKSQSPARETRFQEEL